MTKILYLEDDINLSETIVDFLEDNSFKVTATYDVENTLSILYEENFDLLILDVNVPGGNGFDLLKSLRDASILTPAIFTTSLNSIEDLDTGYKSGADDYLRKPFELKELLLRIDVLLKRQYNTYQDIISINEKTTYNLTTQELKIDEKIETLNNKESKLLRLFIQNTNQCVPFNMIYENVWQFDEVSSETSLRTYIKNLRKLLGKDKIVSIKKMGYKFVV